MLLSVVIPAYNEEKKIRRDLATAGSYLATRPFPSEVIVVDDGSRDGTAEVANHFVATQPPGKVTFRVLGYGGNRGKGHAVRFGITHARGDRIAFMDSGLCVPLHYLEAGLSKIDGGFDYAIASRKLAGTRIARPQPLYRRLGSKAFHGVVRTLMGVDVSDTQCGFKVYRAAAARAIFEMIATDGFMFDVEALIVAKRLGLKGAEFPVEWSNDGDTRYHPVWGTIRNFRELVKIRVRSFSL